MVAVKLVLGFNLVKKKSGVKKDSKCQIAQKVIVLFLKLLDMKSGSCFSVLLSCCHFRLRK